MTVILYSLGSTVAVTLLSAIGVLFFLVREKFMQRFLLPLVGFSTGALLGDVFIHMLPEMAEDTEFFAHALLIVLVGIVFSFCVEKLIHWRHCHVLPHEGHVHCQTVGIMSMTGEIVHNFIDGVIIAASFLVSIPLGVASTLAIVFHEIPHEIGNFAVLLHSGFTRSRALQLNLLSGCAGILGTIGVLVMSQSFAAVNQYLLPFAAGNLLYIAGSDLIPELHKQTKLSQGALQLLAMVLGMLLMYGVLFVE